MTFAALSRFGEDFSCILYKFRTCKLRNREFGRVKGTERQSVTRPLAAAYCEKLKLIHRLFIDGIATTIRDTHEHTS